MKGLIEMNILKVNGIEMSKVIADDPNFQKALRKNLDIMCRELEKYFKTQKIVTKFSYQMVSND